MYVYEEIRDELKKNRYVIYKVDRNKPELAFKFSGKKSELKEKITKKYLKKNNPHLFFVCFKFSFHTGTKQFQGGPLAVRLSSFIFHNNELVSGYRHNDQCKKFLYDVWFPKKYLEKNGWDDNYLENIINKLLKDKVKMYPLVVNTYIEFI
jgi:hypothetical protein